MPQATIEAHMRNVIFAVILSVSATFAGAAWYFAAEDSTRSNNASADVDGLRNGRTIEQRIAALEQAVSDERQARQLLQEEILILTAMLEDLQPEAGDALDRDSHADRNPAISIEERRQMFARRNSPGGRAERLVEAGFSPGLAAWIVQREEELQMEALQARYEAGRSGSPVNFYRDQMSTSNALREELGDAEYERYLEANGRPTTVSISSVIGSSPAESAGLMPRDEIVRYDGERVFSMTDINLATMEGQSGQNVVVDVVRDGVPMQIVLPRGPLGITGGRNRR